ncbi:MAG: sigma-E processing peptidase SpoIIGA [Prevotella sp.]|nr:sigma-E processing peptidase SpoIIGA [Prevotella sp.]
MAAILTFAFAFGSAMYAFNSKYVLVIVVLLFYIIIQKLLYWRRRQKFLHRTIIEYGGKCFRVNALLDSGNALVDPVSQTPVSMISLAVFLQMFPQVSADQILLHELENCVTGGHYIDCQTVNGKGQVFVFSPDKMQINGTTVSSLLGVSTQNFGNQKYDAILNIKLGGVL